MPTKKPRRYRIKRAVGPHSKTTEVAKIDGRSREGKFARLLRDELWRHVGGAPTVPQQLLIQGIIVKVIRLNLMTQRILGEGAADLIYDEKFLAWSNSVRRDLEALGMKLPAQQAPLLANYLEGRQL